jgi:hypothetical protein
MVKMELSKINIYRMTHIKNIPHILQYGITHKNSPDANPDYITIGDKNLIDTRATKHVNISNGDRSQSYGEIVLGDYIPFYFGIRMPMLYVIQCVEKTVLPQDIVYLVCRIIDVIQLDVTYYFSDEHALTYFSSFYDSSKISDLPDIIDWDAIKAHYWGGEENLLLRNKKQAEFLVADNIPAKCLLGFVCYNESAKENLISAGVESEKIRIAPNAYY